MVDDGERTNELQRRISQLEHALEVARVVNVAVGIIMVKHRISQEDATILLKKASRDQQIKLVEVAQAQIRAAEAISIQVLL